MTGDGVNDIPALKAADCSIAMASGSDAGRHAAQLTLLDSDFSVMPHIVLEGRKVINNITRTASLFLMKTLFSMGLSILMLFFPGTYPFQPIQMALVSSLMVGFPGFVLSLEPSTERIRSNFLTTVLRRALPGGTAVTVCAAVAMLLSTFGWERAACSTLATILAGVIGFTVLLITCLPLNRLRAALLGVIAVGFTGALLFLPGVFYLVPLNEISSLTLLILSAVGVGIVLSVRAFDRLPASARMEQKLHDMWERWDRKKYQNVE
jgi:cation-transporting ATPase E